MLNFFKESERIHFIYSESSMETFAPCDVKNRSCFFFSFLQDENLEFSKYLSTETYINDLNRIYSDRTLDIAPYHFFVGEDKIYANKNLFMKVLPIGEKKAYEDDISIMILCDNVGQMSNMIKQNLAELISSLSIECGVMIDGFAFADESIEEKYLEAIRDIRILSVVRRNSECSILAAKEDYLFYCDEDGINRLTQEHFSEEPEPQNLDYICAYSTPAYNSEKNRAIIKLDGKILSPFSDYKEIFRTGDQKTVILFSKDIDISKLEVDVLSNGLSISHYLNDKVDVLQCPRTKAAHVLLMQSFSLSEEDFCKLNQHIYTLSNGNYVYKNPSDYVLIPSCVNFESGYKIVNQLKQAERDFLKTSEY